MLLLAPLFSYVKIVSFWAIGLLGVGFIITFHEFGHFLFCKLFNIKTPTFSIGFGPTLLQKKIGETLFVIAAIPFGGYVEQDAVHNTYELGRPYYQKFLVLMGGILFNIVLAIGIFTLLYTIGMPNIPLAYPLNATPTVQHVMPTSPAEQAHIQPADTLLAYKDGDIWYPITTVSSFLNFVQTHPGHTIILKFEQAGIITEQSVTIQSRSQQPTKGYLGIIFTTHELEHLSLPAATGAAIKTVWLLIQQLCSAFARIIHGTSSEQLGGPIMLISQTIKTVEHGFKIFISLLAIISINLAIINLIPLPILDGGQLLLVTIEALIGRSLSLRIKEYIFVACWALVLLMVGYLSIKDIKFLRRTPTQTEKHI